ncbi:MAG: hypothetical protein ACKVJK_22495, partial [Methylophagaceae bacterium]
MSITGDIPNPKPGGLKYAYQWQHSTDGITFTNVPSIGQGATYDTQNSGLTSSTTYFRRSYTYLGVGGITCTEFSNVHTIFVNNLTPGSVGPPNQVVSFGGSPSLIGSTLAATGYGGIAYQWEMAYDQNPSSAQPAPTYSAWFQIPGATTTNYQPKTNTLRTTKFRRQATSSASFETYTVSLTGANNTETYTIRINGTPYVATANAASTNVSITAQLQILVDADPNVTAVVSTTASILIISSNIANNSLTVVPTTTDGGITFGPVVDITSESVCTLQYSNESVVTVVDEILIPTTAGNNTICTTDTPANLGAMGLAVTAPRTGALTYLWYISTDNSSFTAAAGLNTNPAAYSPVALTATTYYKLETINTYNDYQTQRITLSGNSAVGDSYTLTIGGTSYTVTATAAIFTPSQILSSLTISVTADVNVTPVHYGGSVMDLVSITPGANNTITLTSSGGATGTFTGPVTSVTATNTYKSFSEVITV